MAAINQRIPNFLGGVSQQPDFVKFPGQLRTCHNAHPDVTFGLVKRPPGEYVGTLTGAESGGYWFDIDRDSDKKYIVQVTSTPEIKVWDLATGAAQTVNLASGVTYNYLTRSGAATKPLSVLTINDYTFIANPDVTVGTARTTDSFGSSYGFVTLNTVTYNSEYVVALDNPNITTTTKYRAKTVSVVRTGTNSATWTDENEAAEQQGQETVISNTAGSVGVEVTVTVSGAIYADGTSDYDSAYYATVVLVDGGDDVTDGSTFTVDVEGQSYTVEITGVVPYASYVDNNAAYYRTPKNANEGELNIDSVLGELADAIEAKYTNVTATPIGYGIYITANTGSFDSITVRGGVASDALYGFTDSIQNVARLPAECKHGYKVKVSNTEATEDDYYVEFIADDEDQGSGSWEETVAGGIDAGFNYTTMPHALVNNLDGTFTFTTLDPTNEPDNHWVDRQAGDDDTNPMPTFVGLNISSLFFYRNRLGIIADEQVVMGQPADYFNFFITSALSVSDSDPIDLAASDIKPALINHALPVQRGVMLFSENAQFMLFTDSETFSPETAQLKKLSSYECSEVVSPADMGTSIMFISNSSSFTKAFEIEVGSEDTSDVVEQTRVVPEFVPKSITKVTNSTQDGIVTYFAKNSKILYHYKYYNVNNKREQSAWYTWELPDGIQHALYTSGSFFAVTLQGSEYILSRHELITESSSDRSYVLGTGTPASPLTTSRRFEAALDNMFVPESSGKYMTGENSNIVLPYTVQTGTGYDLVMVVLSGNDTGYVASPDNVSGNIVTFNDIDVTNVNVAVGYKYTTEIQLPSYFYTTAKGSTDVDGDLRIHRINFELGVSGPMEFHLTSPQTDDHVQYWSGIVADISDFNTVPAKLFKQVSVPIYKRNGNYNLIIKIPDPFTATIVSGSWDGRYDNRRYVRK